MYADKQCNMMSDITTRLVGPRTEQRPKGPYRRSDLVGPTKPGVTYRQPDLVSGRQSDSPGDCIIITLREHAGGRKSCQSSLVVLKVVECLGRCPSRVSQPLGASTSQLLGRPSPARPMRNSAPEDMMLILNDPVINGVIRAAPVPTCISYVRTHMICSLHSDWLQHYPGYRDRFHHMRLAFKKN
uniref:Uncharacterized protein n=1 Tax=Timema monikensis TaxID=170555 RepID=A0A7R9HQW6_9NEOP|nr:unnamed protein product [Timema monikensis]